VNDTFEKIRDLCLEQAKYFLENSGEFYPFGVILLPDGSLKPISVSIGEEYPDPNELITMLKNEIQKRLSTTEIIAGGIGVDVFIKSPKDGVSLSAIEVKAIDKEGAKIAWYLPYFLQGKNVFYQDLIEEAIDFF